MLNSSTDFPNAGSYAFMRDAPRRKLRIIQRNADGTLLVSGSKDGRSVTTTVKPDDLIPADHQTRAA